MVDPKMKDYILKALLDLVDLENPPQYFIRFLDQTKINYLDPKTLKNRTDVQELTVKFQFLEIRYQPQKQRVILKQGIKTLAEYEVDYGKYIVEYKNPNSNNKKLTRFIRRQSKNLDQYLRHSLMPTSIRYILDLNAGA